MYLLFFVSNNLKHDDTSLKNIKFNITRIRAWCYGQSRRGTNNSYELCSINQLEFLQSTLKLRVIRYNKLTKGLYQIITLVLNYHYTCTQAQYLKELYEMRYNF